MKEHSENYVTEYFSNLTQLKGKRRSFSSVDLSKNYILKLRLPPPCSIKFEKYSVA
jgi:hypothetical protein